MQLASVLARQSRSLPYQARQFHAHASIYSRTTGKELRRISPTRQFSVQSTIKKPFFGEHVAGLSATTILTNPTASQVFTTLCAVVATGAFFYGGYELLKANPDALLPPLPKGDDYDKLPESLKKGSWGILHEGTSKKEFYRIKEGVDKLLEKHNFPAIHVAFLDRLGVLRIDKVDAGSELHRNLVVFAKENKLEILFEDAKGKLKVSIGKYTKYSLCDLLDQYNLLGRYTVVIGDQMHMASLNIPAADLDLFLGVKAIQKRRVSAGDDIRVTRGFNVGPTVNLQNSSIINTFSESTKIGPEATLAILKQYLQASKEEGATFTFCLDVDNTLIDPEKPLHPGLKKVLKELLETGNRIILVTVGSFTKKLDMFSSELLPVKSLPSKRIELYVANISGTIVKVVKPFFS